MATSRTVARNRLILALVLLVLALIGYVVSSRYAPQKPGTDTNASSTVQAPTSTTSTPAQPAVGQATLDGAIVCLPHRDQTGPQTLECAIGFRGDDGNNYGLSTTRAADESLTTELPTGARVRVQGSVTPAAALSSDLAMRYDVAGVINVTSIEKL